jgi:hypothetical protein
MCPSYLDGDHALRTAPERRPAKRAVIPVCWHGCAVFKVREEAHARIGRSVSQNSTACARELESSGRQVRSTFR